MKISWRNMLWSNIGVEMNNINKVELCNVANNDLWSVRLLKSALNSCYTYIKLHNQSAFILFVEWFNNWSAIKSHNRTSTFIVQSGSGHTISSQRARVSQFYIETENRNRDENTESLEKPLSSAFLSHTLLNMMAPDNIDVETTCLDTSLASV